MGCGGLCVSFEQLFEVLPVFGQLSGLPAGQDRGEQLADSVALKGKGDGDPRPRAVIERRYLPLATAITGRPAMPRLAHVVGGFSSVTSSVVASARGPKRRVTRTFEPTARGASPCRRADTTLPTHAGWCTGSAAYAKTSSGRRDISTVATISAIAPPLLAISRGPA